MPQFPETKNGLARLRIAFERCARQARNEFAVKAGRRLKGVRAVGSDKQKLASDRPKPIVFASACVDQKSGGGKKYNGGLKMLNLLVKMLRQHDYEAYMVTYDGSYDEWLVDHPQYISIAEYREKLAGRDPRDVRCVTSWIESWMFRDYAPNLYFWDMELAYSEHTHYAPIADAVRKNDLRIAGCNRMIQAWHMANWGKPACLLELMVDPDVWYPSGEKQKNLVGYMWESPATDQEIAAIREACEKAGCNLEFELIRGTEAECAASMRRCSYYLGMNHGKEPLWGEGFGLPMLEAMQSGCYVISNDLLGNREYMVEGYTGRIVRPTDTDAMSKALIEAVRDPQSTQQILDNARNYAASVFHPEPNWPAVVKWLEL